jgi:heat shock protein HslJ
MKARWALAAVLCVGAFLTACSQPPDTRVEGDYRITEVAGNPVPADVVLTARLKDGHIQGAAGCSGYSTAYTASQGRIHVGELASQVSFCTGVRGQIEAEVIAGLAGATRYELDGDVLSLRSDAEQQLILHRSAPAPAAK